MLWGGISDYLGRKHSAAAVYLTLAASYLLFALVKMTPAFYVSAVLFGLCYSGIPTILAAASGDYVGRRLASAGLGFITLFFGIGQALDRLSAVTLPTPPRLFPEPSFLQGRFPSSARWVLCFYRRPASTTTKDRRD